MALPVFSALVAELMLASTRHMIAASISLDPKLALATLLKLRAFNKLQKLFVLFKFCIVDSVLFAGHALMIVYSTS